ncbi:MAG: YbhN family protein [Bernardetiaceae bacterium]
MGIDFKSLIQYSLSLLLAAALFAYVYGHRELSDFWPDTALVRWEWIVLSFLFAMLSHLSRAWRWVIALRPLGYRSSLGSAFVAVMISHLANLVIPRMGEFSRCAVLQKSENVPFTVSFGTVVTERVIDLLFLVLIICLTLVLEFSRVGQFVLEQIGAQEDAFRQKLLLAGVTVLLLGLGLGVVYLFRERLSRVSILAKGISFLRGMRLGLLSVLHMEASLLWQYLLHSFLIWFLYFLMTYILFPALPATEDLGLSAGFVVLMMGSFGMLMPVQAGIGFYHLFVSVGVAAFGVGRADAEDFAFLIHGSQTLGVVAVGGICLLVSIIQKKKLKTDNPPVR